MRMVIGVLALASAACSAHEVPVSSAVAPIVPQEITFADLEKHNMFGAGCYFLDGVGQSGSEKARMLFIASDDRGWLKLGGDAVVFEPDRKSLELPYVSWSRYVGADLTVELERTSDQARSTGPETETAPGRIAIRDTAKRVVFEKSGAIDCGA